MRRGVRTHHLSQRKPTHRKRLSALRSSELNTETVLGLAVLAFAIAMGIALLRRARRDRDPQARARRLREDARRFSKLLVSEVKLYNEQLVTEGCGRHDLYDRLREDIDRARARYEKRVDHLVMDGDYFHEALVDILCEGDSERLGAEYPGPRMHTVQ